MKKDLTTLADIQVMVDAFYDQVNQDDLLAPVFNDVAQVNWAKHLPLMYSFWNRVLFAEGDYRGKPFPKHLPLPINEAHFERWVALFDANMDALFEGPIADDAKLRARSIAHVFQAKLGLIEIL